MDSKDTPKQNILPIKSLLNGYLNKLYQILKNGLVDKISLKPFIISEDIWGP